MSQRAERPRLPLIAVYGETAASAQRRVVALLEAAGTSPAEAQRLIAAIQAGAVEGAHGEVIELDTHAPASSSDEFQEGWRGAIEAASGQLAHIADRTVRKARTAAAASEIPPAAPSRPQRSAPTAVDSVGEEQVHQVLEAAERIFVSLTGYTGYDRGLSEDILPVVLKAVSAEQQDGYVQRLEAFAEDNRERLAQLYGKYGPGGPFEDQARCYLTHQPESVVVCERLDTVPLWLDGVWNNEIDAELVLERFTKFWRFGLGA
ncbi:hypothetical protein PV332_14405 [Streptomyces scabiei]|uniref:hypothetical protein n=1 Tax=Streptomyces scabiei TaxID=1930 RepID=UPI0029A48DF7|nr:hypothetical protein [Streptomyces scabiei]MDX2576661.1 hypothetical protein [Streptomyces scabiei]MDX3027657.1 hypothetical protein [Streptomyces scabiei]MDX3206324.1 hypothetical protein [Streptomyces scabiei]